jgi:hypothetical protein
MLRRRPSALLAALLAIVLAGCAEVVRQPPPPPLETERLAVLGIADARFFPDGPSEPLERIARRAAERQAGRGSGQFLALSGGGDNGAFGAGLMLGWTAAGTRPEFDVVTGISAGALIAPFAFLGPAYDEALRALFTEISPRDVLELPRLFISVLFRAAIADTLPLARLIERHATEEMLAAIAQEYARGRLLLIGTVNLDLQRPVIWDIGAIAASRHPDSLSLFRRILLASASIPGAFPPVLIEVERAGQRHQEMHVDGGAAMQVFFYPPSLDLSRLSRRARTVHVVRNGRMDIEAEDNRVGLFGIARRSMQTLLHFAGVADVERIQLTTLRDGIGFRFAAIAPEFRADRAEPFDRDYMRALFAHGFEGGRSGTVWRTTPGPVRTLSPTR